AMPDMLNLAEPRRLRRATAIRGGREEMQARRVRGIRAARPRSRCAASAEASPAARCRVRLPTLAGALAATVEAADRTTLVLTAVAMHPITRGADANCWPCGCNAGDVQGVRDEERNVQSGYLPCYRAR